MSPLTLFLAKLIGLYALIFGVAMIVQKRATVGLVPELIRNGPVLLVIEMLGITAGLAIVIGHNVWTGGALPVVVTLLGWIMLVRRVVLLLLWPEAKTRFIEAFRFADFFYLYAAFSLALGLYLTIAGFAG
jgi:hypothetical protein